jgi:4-hydroxybenzoate polyprenyltransferase
MDDRSAGSMGGTSGNVLGELVRLARPSHWIKNAIVLLPVVFAKSVLDAASWARAGVAACAFCLASSAVYAANDIVDREQDRQHPDKGLRPVAAGRLSIVSAATESILLAVAALALAYGVNPLVCLCVLAYLLLQMAYSLYLKSKMIVDVICIALGFVLRAAAGALAIRVEVSHWLVVCTFTLCLFMGFCKRRNEVGLIGDMEAAVGSRPTLSTYTPELLTHLITLSASIAIVSYLLYASSARTIGNVGTPYLVYTLPFVVYGVCRFAMLSMTARYRDPIDLILSDRPFQATLALWFGCTFVVLFWGSDLETLFLRWCGSEVAVP